MIYVVIGTMKGAYIGKTEYYRHTKEEAQGDIDASPKQIMGHQIEYVILEFKEPNNG